LDHQENNRNDQDEMDQTACDVKAEPEEPKDDENNYEGIEHIECGFVLSSRLVMAARVKLFRRVCV
jgi:hypothetical protein